VTTCAWQSILYKFVSIPCLISASPPSIKGLDNICISVSLESGVNGPVCKGFYPALGIIHQIVLFNIKAAKHFVNKLQILAGGCIGPQIFFNLAIAKWLPTQG
jgi:hypothetical protein